MRLSTLERGQIYLSSLDQFNDPFEGKVFVFEEDELTAKGWSKELFEETILQVTEKGSDKYNICYEFYKDLFQ